MNLDPRLIEIACEGLVSFRLEDQPFAIPISLVREINRHLELTHVHRSPASVRGLVNLRGQIVTVVDFGECLGFGPRPITETSRLVVLKESADLHDNLPEGIGTEDATIGLLVDRISDVLSPKAQDIEPPPPHLRAFEHPYVIAVCKTATHTVGVLNPAALVEVTTEQTVRSLEGLPGSTPNLGSIEGKTNAQAH